MVARRGELAVAMCAVLLAVACRGQPLGPTAGSSASASPPAAIPATVEPTENPPPSAQDMPPGADAAHGGPPGPLGPVVARLQMSRPAGPAAPLPRAPDRADRAEWRPDPPDVVAEPEADGIESGLASGPLEEATAEHEAERDGAQWTGTSKRGKLVSREQRTGRVIRRRTRK